MSWSTTLTVKNTALAAEKVRAHFASILSYEGANKTEVALKDQVCEQVLTVLAGSDPDRVYNIQAGGSSSWAEPGKGNYHNVNFAIVPVYGPFIE